MAQTIFLRLLLKLAKATGQYYLLLPTYADYVEPRIQNRMLKLAKDWSGQRTLTYFVTESFTVSLFWMQPKK